MRRFIRPRQDWWRIALVATATACLSAYSNRALAVIVYGGGTYSQNFNSLTSVQDTTSSTQAWTNDSTLTGWSLFAQPAPGTAITSYKGGDGSVNTGSYYSFGGSGSNERALGGLASGGAYFGSPLSGALAGWLAVGVSNNTGSAISSFTVNYDGEQWRDGGAPTTGSVAQTMVMEYGYGATFGAVASWTAAGPAFNFTSPTIGATTGIGLDGNLPANRIAGLGGTINSTWSNGSTLWVRWIENNDVSNDHALAIDNFSLTTSQVPEPATNVLLGLGALGLAVLRRRRK